MLMKYDKEFVLMCTTVQHPFTVKALYVGHLFFFS